DAVDEDHRRIVEHEAAAPAALHPCRLPIAVFLKAELRCLAAQHLPRVLATGAGDHRFGDNDPIGIIMRCDGCGVKGLTGGENGNGDNGAKLHRSLRSQSTIASGSTYFIGSTGWPFTHTS